MTAKIGELGKVVETDVLVIGGGIAGAFAAIAAREYPTEVTLVDKGTFGRSGCAAVASGVWRCFLPGDDFELWYKDYIDVGIPLVDQKLLKKHIVETAKTMKKMDEWGVKWMKEDGKFVRSKATGDAIPRNAMMAEGGPQMMLAVRNEALRRGVRAINKVMITDLLTSDGEHPTKGKVVGAIGFHIVTGDMYVFKAKATVLAPGGVKGLPYAKPGPWQVVSCSIMPNNLTGDGHAMAFRVGAELINMDQVMSIYGVHLKDVSCGPSMNLFMALGAKLTNRLGERFMEKYDPVRKESAHRWLTGAAMAQEYREGRGPVTLDCTHFTPEQVMLCKRVIPIIMESLEKGGYDITKDKIVYQADYGGGLSGTCGARTNEAGETSIEALYAAGGSTVVTLLALPGCAISGWHAGESAGAFSLKAGAELMRPKVVKQAEKLQADTLMPLKVKDGVGFREVHENIARVMKDDIRIFLHEERLKKASKKLADLAKEMPTVRAGDYRELAKVVGLRNFVQVLELAISAARRRTESREGFVREDYPETDNINWLKHVLLQGKDGKIRFWEEPVPGAEEVPIKRGKIVHMVFQGQRP